MQQFAVKWLDKVSMSFTVCNGVRKGSVLSPHLFNFFVDELSVLLSRSNIGCYLNNVCYNNLLYVDDANILAPSPPGLQKLLDICAQFAADNAMVFNSKKIVCMCIPYKQSYIWIPGVFLNDNNIEWTDKHKHLGVIRSDFADDCDIKRQMKSIYAKGKFNDCSKEVKVHLFKTLCRSMYCCALWCNFRSVSHKSIMVVFIMSLDTS